MDAAQLAAINERLYLLNPFGPAIAQIDAKQNVGAIGRIDCGTALRFVTAERLLAEHRNPVLHCPRRLHRVKCARCRDHDAVEIAFQQRIEIGDALCCWREA